MINKLHSMIFKPERGWDPISAEYAQRYSERAWQQWDDALLNRLEEIAGGFVNKEVLDLAGGPGQCSVSFARRGAQVTWYDISDRYRIIAQKKAVENKTDITFIKGYLDDAPKILKKEYDIVYSRVSWYYCIDDKIFSEAFYKLIKPGGIGYIETDHSDKQSWNFRRNVVNLLNKHLWIKIGHPYPPHGRIASLFNSFPIDRMIVDYSDPEKDKVIIVK